ncbi:MerR family transcriptional regulator [Actinoplanes missouriensis]|uniref:MerR family transcriptional regulator n=1 Tax=Actinoplanes missouriensis TaxID=1866 RepID=UPI003410D56D
MWTMEQLVERAHAALAAEYPGAPNGRVRDLPDRRSIRWYTTIGLVDRPLGTRGRTALYGPRHLLQLVAIKRRQAAGRTLAEIQAELTGASDETLAAASRVPEGLLTHDEPATADAPDGAGRSSFWKQAPSAPPPGDLRRVPPGLATYEPGVAHAAPDITGGPLLTGFPLGDGVILLVPGPAAGIDRDNLAAAARPLLDLLASRGLTNGRNE